MSHFQEIDKIETIKQIITNYAKGRKYFSLGMVKKHLKSIKTDFSDASVKQYLHDLNKDRAVFDAGRGWYSTLSKAYELDTALVDPVINIIKKDYPLLPFCVWSSEQVKYHVHHMLVKFVVIVYSERDYLLPLFEYLRNSEYDTYLNPTILESRKNFSVEEKPLVLRPSISREPSTGHYADVEKILVDLKIENDKIWVMGDSEYEVIFNNIAGESRINPQKLLNYAERRKVINQIKPFMDILAPL